MNTNASNITKTTILMMACGVFLGLLNASKASAHTIEYRPYFVQDYYVYKRTRPFPHWLRRNRDFQHWYWHGSYHLKRHISWRRLYDIYRHERRHRFYSRRFYGKVYRNTGHAHYYMKPKKRWK